METILEAKNLRKVYTIFSKSTTSLKEMVVKNLFAPGEKRELVAVDDISFSLEKGRSLAIIGPNGSGKSTLLKMVAGLTDPDSGELSAKGRIAALLSMGAGFEQEFTGMENIFLQCSILGLTRKETLERLGDILAFSQLDTFIHTPVKKYSSGMYIRLGFSIAAHVDADLLLLDEVLAVGDTAFQVRCMRKIAELRKAGKSIIFVSHCLEHIEAIADQVLWIDHGKMKAFGSAEDILPEFYESINSAGSSGENFIEMDERTAAALPTGRFESKKAHMTNVRFLNSKGEETQSFTSDELINIEMEVEISEKIAVMEVSYAFGTMDSLRAVWHGTGQELKNLEPGKFIYRATVNNHHLVPGRYLVSFMLGDPETLETIYDLHLRLYALSLKDRNGKISHNVDESRLTPLGEFDLP